jgi:ATP-dependent Clp protease ATP-binding subunit ClpB
VLSSSLQAAQLSDRYISSRFLPDKAIDLIDESAAELKMQVCGILVHCSETGMA